MVEIISFAQSWYFVYIYFNIETSGYYMEYNINSDKLILEWIANCTPPSCIQVNILSMAMDTNHNSKVANMIPGIK